MRVQLDTNILTRLSQKGHAMRGTAEAAVAALRAQGRSLCIVPQNLYEFWAVATRPIGENGLGLAVSEVHRELLSLRALFVLMPDTPTVLDEWQRLVVAHGCKGKPAHDARIVAAMNVHGVKELLTFNIKDFLRYTAITVLDPAAVVAARAPGGP